MFNDGLVLIYTISGIGALLVLAWVKWHDYRVAHHPITPTAA